MRAHHQQSSASLETRLASLQADLHAGLLMEVGLVARAGNTELTEVTARTAGSPIRVYMAQDG